MDQCSNSPRCQCSLRRQQQHAKDGWGSEIFAGKGGCRPKLGAQQIPTKNRGTVTGINGFFSHFETYPNYVPNWQPVSPDSCQPWGPHETMCATCQHPRFKEAWPIDGARCFNCSFGASGFQWPKSLDDPPGDRNFHEQLGSSNDEWLITLVIYDLVSGMIIQVGNSFGCLVGYSNYFLLQCTASYISSHNIINIIPFTRQFTCLSSTFSTWKLALHSLHSAFLYQNGLNPTSPKNYLTKCNLIHA